MTATVSGGDLKIQINHFSLSQTLSCGQCFRFDQVIGNPDRWRGIAGGRVIEVFQNGNELTFINMSKDEFEAVWADYFDLNTDYEMIQNTLCTDPTLKTACDFCNSIRIIRQDPWEALCSFILSQNNNIPRIKGLVTRLCEQFGNPIDGDFDFPKPEKLAPLSPEDLTLVRCGFRDKYILDAAKKFASGEINPKTVAKLPLDEARAQLMTINGVGPKVADCALLFGFYKMTAFPTDVWIKRAMADFFPNGLPACAQPYAGIAQQVLFHYYRSCVSEKDKI